MKVGDTVILPFNEAATDIDVRKIVGIVVSINDTSISVINGYGDITVSMSEELHTLATFDKTLVQFTQKGVELIDKCK